MNKSFKYITVYTKDGKGQVDVEVTINIKPGLDMDDPADYEIENIQDMNSEAVYDYNDFDTESQVRIDEKAQLTADKYGYEAYIELSAINAELAYDRWVDMQSDNE